MRGIFCGNGKWFMRENDFHCGKCFAVPNYGNHDCRKWNLPFFIESFHEKTCTMSVFHGRLRL